MSLFSKSAQSPESCTEITRGLDAGANKEPYATDGSVGIGLVADHSDAVLDIIFVHGLTGNRDKTWTNPKGTFWPGALLSQDFPRARIMTFGYDADVVRFWTIASSNRLSHHGKSLAYALLDQRAQASRRPIIKREDVRTILSNTLGIIFMATPHGGSRVASWGNTVAKYVNVFRGTNREILENLQPRSSDLQRTEEDFQYMLRQHNVILKI
ncbi:hypothetical protein B0J12DRAFT_741718 [Macrophomina phaseolina]|uniref:Uncharacterized protein n=1 Tax=Macrophomina phaseolina TaxID=35725 RepID=A0ABQ8GA43_9PEZI|nr:hypothetical protein B0J12DRAFT_741718 [Macrophomina phaseolina]